MSAFTHVLPTIRICHRMVIRAQDPEVRSKIIVEEAIDMIDLDDGQTRKRIDQITSAAFPLTREVRLLENIIANDLTNRTILGRSAGAAI